MSNDLYDDLGTGVPDEMPDDDPREELVHVTVTMGDDDEPWAYECSPGDHEDSEYHFEGDVPKSLLTEAQVASSTWRKVQQRIAKIVGLDLEEGFRLRECCPSWRGHVRQEHTYFGVTMPARVDEWPLHPYRLSSAETEADAALQLADLPDEFMVSAHGTQLVKVTRAELYVEPYGWRASESGCYRCGWSRTEHSDAGEEA